MAECMRMGKPDQMFGLDVEELQGKIRDIKAHRLQEEEEQREQEQQTAIRRRLAEVTEAAKQLPQLIERFARGHRDATPLLKLVEVSDLERQFSGFAPTLLWEEQLRGPAANLAQLCEKYLGLSVKIVEAEGVRGYFLAVNIPDPRDREVSFP